MVKEGSTKEIKVKLRKDGNKDVLEFCLTPTHILDLNNDNQDAIKSMFCSLIPLLKADEVQLALEVDEDYDDSELMKEVAEDYIKDLNSEIDNVRTKILKDYSDNNLAD